MSQLDEGEKECDKENPSGIGNSKYKQGYGGEESLLSETTSNSKLFI